MRYLPFPPEVITSFDSMVIVFVSAVQYGNERLPIIKVVAIAMVNMIRVYTFICVFPLFIVSCCCL